MLSKVTAICILLWYYLPLLRHGPSLAVAETAATTRNESVKASRALFFVKPVLTIVNPTNGAVIATNGATDNTKTTTTVDVSIQAKNGRRNKLSSIDLLLDGKVVATQSTPSTMRQVTFTLDHAGLSKGVVHELQARGHTGKKSLLRRRRSVASKTISFSLLPEGTKAPLEPLAPTKAASPTTAAAAPSPATPSKADSPISSPVTATPPSSTNRPPSNSPTFTNSSSSSLRQCDLDQSFLYFAGHNEAISAAKGVVNLTWSPAFALSLPASSPSENANDLTFLWCGNVSYDIFYVQGDYNFADLNATVPELLEQRGKLQHVETSARSLVLSNLEPAVTYSILVTAKTARGHYSYNRDPALLNISATNPVVKSNFTRVVMVPSASESFSIVTNLYSKTVVFSGILPPEVQTLQSLDFVYLLDSDGNSTMAQLWNKTSGSGGSIAGPTSWTFRPADLSDIFDELDLNADVVNPDTSKDPVATMEDDDDDDDDGDIVLSDAEWAALDINVKLNLCFVANPGPDGTAYCLGADLDSDQLRRRLGIRSWAKKAAKSIKKGAKSLGDALVDGFKKAGNYLANIVFRGQDASTTKQLFDIVQAAKLTRGPALEVGMKFDAAARGRFSITYSYIKAIHAGAVQLSGGIGVEGYLYFADRYQTNLKPDPIEIFRKSYDYVFFIGIVPVVVTVRPSVYAFAELAMAAEGQALAAAAYGYDFIFDFSYDKSRSERFQKSTQLTRRPRYPIDPVINIRLNAKAELGVTLGVDLLLYYLFQASLAVDVGVQSEMEVGANIESIAITKPYFYTLNQFDIDAFVRVRAFLGFNTDLQQLLPDKCNDGAVAAPPTNETAEFKFERTPTYQIPSPAWAAESSSLSAPLQKGLDKATVDPILQDATSLSLAQLNALEPDPFSGTSVPLVTGTNCHYGWSWTLYTDEFRIASLPMLTLSGGLAEICPVTSSDAIKLKINALSSRDSSVQKASSMWFANFDGKVLKEATAWTIGPNRTNFDSVTLSLPRSAIRQPGFTLFELHNESSVYLRATPKLMPFPRNNMFVKAKLRTLFPNLVRFECCDDADCAYLYRNETSRTSTCHAATRMCRHVDRFRAWPDRIAVNQSSSVILTVNLTGIPNATAVHSFEVYRVDPLSQHIGSTSIVTLEDIGSGRGNDTVAGDLVFSNNLALRSSSIGEGFGFQAVPVMKGTMRQEPNNPAFTFTKLNAVQSVAAPPPTPTGSTTPNVTSTMNLTADRIDGLILVIEYSWPRDKRDLDTGTFFLGNGVGFMCEYSSIYASPYMVYAGDNTAYGGNETVYVLLGKSYSDLQWGRIGSTSINTASIAMHADWHNAPNRGPALITLYTVHLVGAGSNATLTVNSGVSTFVVDPGVQTTCATSSVANATVVVASDGKVSIRIQKK